MLTSPIQRQLREQYLDLVKDRFGHIFESYAVMPRAKLTRVHFEKKFDLVHKSGYWSILCDLYAKGIKDPLARSDDFLDAVLIIYRL